MMTALDPPRRRERGGPAPGLGLIALLLCGGLACGDSASTDAAVDGSVADGGADQALEGGSPWPDLQPRADHGGSCAQDRLAVEAELARIGQCTMPGECTSMPGTCPFGCQLPHNKALDTSGLQQLIARYKANPTCLPCSEDCPPPGSLDCVGGRCVVSSSP